MFETETDSALPIEALRFSNAIKEINSIQPKGNKMYIYKPEITYQKFAVNEIKSISDPAEVFAFFKNEILGPVEKVACLFLNGRNNIIDKFIFAEMFTGTVDQCQVYPRDIFKMAILTNSSRVIVCHNHPTGSTSPSNADKEITRILKDGAKLLGLNLLDHLIITEDSYYSFAEDNCL